MLCLLLVRVGGWVGRCVWAGGTEPLCHIGSSQLAGWGGGCDRAGPCSRWALFFQPSAPNSQHGEKSHTAWSYSSWLHLSRSWERAGMERPAVCPPSLLALVLAGGGGWLCAVGDSVNPTPLPT